MTTADMERAIQEVWALFRETQERQRKTDEQMAETDKKIAALSDKVKETTADLSNKWGEFVENVVAPGIKKVFAERGVKLRHVHQRSWAAIEGDEMEIDILAVNSDYAVVVSVKSTLEQEDVDDLLTDLANFKRFFPEYAGKKVLGAVAGIVMPKQITRYAYKKGIFVLGQSGDTIAILNGPKFKPREW